jgi:hypothetical protein
MFLSNFRVLILFTTMLLILSCNSNSDQHSDKVQVDTTLIAVKKQIQLSIDSANIYFDSVLTTVQQSPENKEKILENFKQKKTYYESQINNALEKVNKLGAEGKISQKEADNWLKEFDIAKVGEKYDRIKALN